MKRYLCFFVILLLLISATGCFDDTGSSSLSGRNGASGSGSGNRQICTLCSGNKQVSCNYCSGKGTYSLAGTTVLCMTCSGSGKMNCLGCNGTGYKLQFDDDDSQDTPGSVITPGNNFGQNNQYPNTCAKCGNLGVKTCTGCHGSGSIPKTQYAPDFGSGGGAYQTQVTCKTCGGSGIIDCPYC